MIKSLFLFSFIFILFGCASLTLKNPAPRYAHVENNPPDEGLYTYEIGSPIIRKIVCSKKKAVRILDQVTWHNEVYPAQQAVHVLTDEKYDYYGPLEGPYAQVFLGIHKSEEKAVLFWQDANYNIEKFPNLEYFDAIDKSASYFEQELIYNGRIDDQIKFLYREFSNNSIRGAFTQNVQYDLNRSEEVGFKGARIKIEEASNEQITCYVLSSFTQQ